MTVVAFDIDGCLLNDDDTPNYDTINFLWDFYNLGCTIVIWSGGGMDYAEHWRDRLGLTFAYVQPKLIPIGDHNPWHDVDICFDDEDASALAKVCVRIPVQNVDERPRRATPSGW